MQYFEKRGPVNTAEVAKIAIAKAKETGISHIVVASCSGKAIAHYLDCDLQVVCVTHQVGYKESGLDEMSAETRQMLQARGIPVLTTTHALAGADRALRYQFNGIYPAELIAYSLRLLGQGFKVAVEIAVMATDAGLVPYGGEIISVGGSSSGSDTAIIIKPDHVHNLLKSKVKEILCMPYGY